MTRGSPLTCDAAFACTTDPDLEKLIGAGRGDAIRGS